MIPAGKRETVVDILDDEGIDYVLTDETSGRDYTAVVSFPLPTMAVEPILERLREAGIERSAYTVVLDAETVVSQRFEKLEERYEEENGGSDRIAREELVARSKDLAPTWSTFVVMTSMSAIVATAGLLLDSPAVVVGSMVIAPLIGPAMATSVGSVVAERDLFVRGVKLQLVGGLLAVLAATLFATLLRYTHVIPLESGEVFAIGEVRERLAPDVLSLAVALAAGVAGALSLSSGVSSALVGVMIAAALVPPTAVVGIGLAWGSPSTVFGSAVLVLVNFLSINFAALAVLWYNGYRPEHWLRLDEARTETLSRIAALGVAILVLSSFLGAVTLDSYRISNYEDRAQAETQAVLEDVDGLELISLSVSYGDTIPFRQPSHVTVVVGYPPGTDPPPVARRLSDRLSALESDPLGIDVPGLGAPGSSTERVSVSVHYTLLNEYPESAA
jgi:uncharacterized hydrophobic protein (TIGR00341 family)